MITLVRDEIEALVDFSIAVPAIEKAYRASSQGEVNLPPVGHIAFAEDHWVQPGTDITAVGADAPAKQELDLNLVSRADIVAVDQVSQYIDHGETSHAFRAGENQSTDLIELGTLLDSSTAGRVNPEMITIADLTGIAAQDVAIAQVVLETWKKRNS